MTTKVAIIVTVSIANGAIVLGLATLFVFVDPTSRNANERAALIGRTSPGGYSRRNISSVEPNTCGMFVFPWACVYCLSFMLYGRCC
jgi:hypothetical protein